MRYADITTCDIANGEKLGVVLWCQGCSLACPGCHNTFVQSPAEGREFTQREEDLIFEELKRPQIKRLTLSGGHPLEPYNIQKCTELCKKVKSNFPDVDIWCYTGFAWENVKDLEIMKYLDVLVDGPYIEACRDISLPWRGSSNQRLIDVQASLKNNNVTLCG
jgi:anaerobic ribonucleoside-triphosphate reductase activating protein